MTTTPSEKTLAAIRLVASLSDGERETLRSTHISGRCLVYKEQRTPALEAIGLFSDHPKDSNGETIRDYLFEVPRNRRGLSAIASSMIDGEIDQVGAQR